MKNAFTLIRAVVISFVFVCLCVSARRTQLVCEDRQIPPRIPVKTLS